MAYAIKNGLEDAGVDVSLIKTTEAKDLDYFDYDLVCIGYPSIQWQAPKQIAEFLLKRFDNYRKQNKIKMGSPVVPNKNVLIFCTFSEPHTGLDEATPVGKYLGQFFAHLGFTVLDEWYILSEFHGSKEHSTLGRMGDIREKPTEGELIEIRVKTKKLAYKLLAGLTKITK